jgi:hypothetical protein
MLPYSALMTADSATLPSARRKLAARWVGRSRSCTSTLPSASARARGQPTAGRSRRGTLPFHQLVTLGYRCRGLLFLVLCGSLAFISRTHGGSRARRRPVVPALALGFVAERASKSYTYMLWRRQAVANWVCHKRRRDRARRASLNLRRARHQQPSTPSSIIQAMRPRRRL